MTMNNLKKAELRRFAELDAAKSRLHEDATASASAEADLEMLKEYCDESDAVVDSLARLLAGVALAVRGPEMPLHRHSYHDLPERVAELVGERNRLSALVEDAAMRRAACSGFEAVDEASKILRTHNAWRRGETDDNPHTPKQVGSAIDEVLADLASMRAEVEALTKKNVELSESMRHSDKGYVYEMNRAEKFKIDAIRYQYIRRKACIIGIRKFEMINLPNPPADLLDRDAASNLDMAIDVVMAKEGGANG